MEENFNPILIPDGIPVQANPNFNPDLGNLPQVLPFKAPNIDTSFDIKKQIQQPEDNESPVKQLLKPYDKPSTNPTVLSTKGLDSYRNRGYNVNARDLENPDFETNLSTTQSNWDRLGNNLQVAGANFASMAAVTLLSPIEMLGDISDWIKGKPAIGSDLTQSIFDWRKEVEENNTNFQTQYDKNNPVWSTIAGLVPGSSLLTGASSKGYGEILKSASYGLGAAAGLAVTELVTTALTGGSGTIPLLARNLQRLFNNAKYVDEALSLGGIAGKAASNLNKVLGSGETINRLGNGLTDIYRATAGAYGEALFEGLEAKETVMRNLTDAFIKTHGYEPTGKDLEKITTLSQDAANQRFGLNMLLLGATNYQQFKTLFRGIDNFKDDLITNTRKLGSTLEFDDLGKVIVKDADYKLKSDWFTKGFGKRIAPVVEGTVNLVKKNDFISTGLPEGFEEGSQFAIDKGIENYSYWRATNNGKSDTLELLKSLGSGVKETVTSSEGWDSILTGALAGGLQEGAMQGFNAVTGRTQYKEAKKNFTALQQANADEYNRLLNTSDPNSLLKQVVAINSINGTTQQQLDKVKILTALNNELTQAIENPELFKSLNQVKHFELVKSFAQNGNTDLYVEKLNQFKSLSDADFKTVFNLTSIDNKSKDELVDNMIQEANVIDNSFKRARTALNNPVQYQRNEVLYEGYKEVIDEIAYLDYSSNKFKGRISNLENELGQYKNLGAFTTEKGLKNLAPNMIKNTIDVLDNQIQLQEGADKQDKINKKKNLEKLLTTIEAKDTFSKKEVLDMVNTYVKNSDKTYPLNTNLTSDFEKLQDVQKLRDRIVTAQINLTKLLNSEDPIAYVANTKAATRIAEIKVAEINAQALENAKLGLKSIIEVTYKEVPENEINAFLSGLTDEFFKDGNDIQAALTAAFKDKNDAYKKQKEDAQKILDALNKAGVPPTPTDNNLNQPLSKVKEEPVEEELILAASDLKLLDLGNYLMYTTGGDLVTIPWEQRQTGEYSKKANAIVIDTIARINKGEDVKSLGLTVQQGKLTKEDYNAGGITALTHEPALGRGKSKNHIVVSKRVDGITYVIASIPLEETLYVNIAYDKADPEKKQWIPTSQISDSKYSAEFNKLLSTTLNKQINDKGDTKDFPVIGTQDRDEFLESIKKGKELREKASNLITSPENFVKYVKNYYFGVAEDTKEIPKEGAVNQFPLATISTPVLNGTKDYYVVYKKDADGNEEVILFNSETGQIETDNKFTDEIFEGIEKIKEPYRGQFIIVKDKNKQVEGKNNLESKYWLLPLRLQSKSTELQQAIKHRDSTGFTRYNSNDEALEGTRKLFKEIFFATKSKKGTKTNVDFQIDLGDTDKNKIVIALKVSQKIGDKEVTKTYFNNLLTFTIDNGSDNNGSFSFVKTSSNTFLDENSLENIVRKVLEEKDDTIEDFEITNLYFNSPKIESFEALKTYIIRPKHEHIFKTFNFYLNEELLLEENKVDEPNAPVSNDKPVAPTQHQNNVVSFETSKGSVYTYGNDGKTTRFKTATGEQNAPQDLTVFIQFRDSNQEQDFLKAYRQPELGFTVQVVDINGNIYRTNESIIGKDVRLAIIDNKDNIVESVGISQTPIIGYSVFDRRSFKDDNGENIAERHIGNQIVKINYKNQQQPTPPATVDEDIEAKKADIERRRREELKPIEEEIKKTEKEIEELEKNNKLQGAYAFSATSNNGKWNSANNELLSLVQNNKKAFAIYKFLIGDMQTFKEIVDYLNEKVIEISYTDRMKRADETMTVEEKQSAIDSYNNSVSEKIEDKNQIEKDILSENNLQEETEYTPQELIEKYPLTGVQKIIWNLIKDIVNKLGIKVKFSSSRITEGFDGSNNPQNGEILIRPSTLKNGRFGEVLVHEVIHALTTKIISRVNSGVTTGLTQKQVNAVKGLMKLYEAIKADNNLENKYLVKDVFEFIAHLTNEVFVKELESKDKNFLEKVVDFILDILGINNANELSKKYLVDIISDGVFLEENGITVLPSDYGSKLQGSEEIKQLKDKLKKLKEQINKINAKYDIELAALEQDNPQTQSSILDYFKMFNLSNTSKTELSKYEVVNATGIQTSISKLIALPKTPDFEDTKFLNNFITASLKAGNIKLKKTDAATTRIEDIEELNQKVEQHLKFCYQ